MVNDLNIAAEAEGASEARRLLEGWGAAPLLFFALLPDKRYLLSEPGEPEWGVAYRMAGRHALALGDPLGDPAAAPDAVASFLALCRRHGWKPAFYQVTPAHLETYKAAGLRAVKVGEDAGITLAEWTLAGKKFAKMRNDLRRVEKSGIVLEAYGPSSPPGVSCVAEMGRISAEWCRAHKAKEGFFAMGGFDSGSRLFAESRYFVARDANTGRVVAFTSFVPAYGAGGIDGWTLDLMRRRADAPHGVMEFLIVAAASRFAGEGARRVSLGLSPLAGADDPAEAAATSHVRRFLYARLNRAYNFQGLHAFKGKFAADWESRFLVCPGGVALAATAGAVLKAHTGPPHRPHSGPLRRRSGRRRALVLCALLLLGLAPIEKTLAKRAVLHSGRWSRLQRLHPPHFSLRPASFRYPLHRRALRS